MSSDAALEVQRSHVLRYYHKTESLFGYKYLLGGTKHFGFYEDATMPAYPFSPALRRMEALLAEKLEVSSGSRVLDAGCGMGAVACEVATRTGATVEGIDVLDFNVAAASERAASQGVTDLARFQVMDYSSLQFEDESFDAVYTMETLVHAGDPDRVVAEFRRVLKPGGRLVMFEYARRRPEDMTARANAAFAFVNDHAAMPAFQEVFFYGCLEAKLRSSFSDVTVRDLTSNIMPMLKAFRDLALVPYRVLSLLGKREKGINAMSAVEFYEHRDDFRYELYTARK